MLWLNNKSHGLNSQHLIKSFCSIFNFHALTKIEIRPNVIGYKTARIDLIRKSLLILKRHIAVCDSTILPKQDLIEMCIKKRWV